MALRHLREAKLAGDVPDQALVLRKAVGVHEDDRDGVVFLRSRRLESRAHDVRVGLRFDGPVGEHALVDLDHPGVELLGLDDLLREDLGARLVADLERVTKTARREEQRALAATLEQRVGRDRRAHLDGADRAFRDGFALREPQQAADRLDRGVLVERALRQELSRMQPAVGSAADHVGERAAAIDPEVPAALRRRHACSHPIPNFKTGCPATEEFV